MLNFNFRVDGVGVDAGLILISDKRFYETYNNGEEVEVNPRLSHELRVPDSVYDVKWYIPNTWNGDVNGSGTLKITTGKLIVSDPCYLIGPSDQWDKALNDYDYFQREPEGALVLDSMGGDGEYTVFLELYERDEK